MKQTESHKITYRSVNDLIPYARNSRTHSEDQVLQIASSIKEFGFTNPVLVDSEGGIIAGHGRIMAARKLGIDSVPTIELSHLTETQKRAYIIADNKMALNAGWDDLMLATEFAELAIEGFDLSLTGFSDDEISGLTPNVVSEGLTDPDDVPGAQEESISNPGDIWLLGRHRLMCGDSTSVDEVDLLLNGRAVDMVMTDPPYGVSAVKVNGKVGGGKIVPSNIYAPIDGDESIDVALEAIQVINTLNAKVVIIWGGNYYANALSNSSCWIVWDKQNTGDFADCELAWTNQKSAARIFAHMWNGMIKASEHGEKRVHPTQKPVALFEWCLVEYGDSCEVVLDLFGGSGSSLIACEQMSREARVMEISPHYCDVIIKRWQDYTGQDAIHTDSGETFNSMASN